MNAIEGSKETNFVHMSNVDCIQSVHSWTNMLSKCDQFLSLRVERNIKYKMFGEYKISFGSTQVFWIDIFAIFATCATKWNFLYFILVLVYMISLCETWEFHIKYHIHRCIKSTRIQSSYCSCFGFVKLKLKYGVL